MLLFQDTGCSLNDKHQTPINFLVVYATFYIKNNGY